MHNRIIVLNKYARKKPQTKKYHHDTNAVLANCIVLIVRTIIVLPVAQEILW